MTPHFLFVTTLSGWLAACVVYDLRSRQLPLPLTVTPLLTAGLWRLISGDWPLAVSLALLIIISELPFRLARGVALAAISLLAISFPEHGMEMAALLFPWLLWTSGQLGGADAKMMMALVLILCSPWVLLPVFIAGGAQGLIGKAFKEDAIPFTISIAAGSAWYLMT